MQVSKTSVMAIKAYQDKAEVLVRNYLLADPFVHYTSVFGGIFMCKMVCISSSMKKLFSRFIVYLSHTALMMNSCIKGEPFDKYYVNSKPEHARRF